MFIVASNGPTEPHYNPEFWCQTHHCKFELKYETWFGTTQTLTLVGINRDTGIL